MDGLKKYVVIIVGAIFFLWLLSIIIYWDAIGDYIAQSVGVIISAIMNLIVGVILILLLIRILK